MGFGVILGIQNLLHWQWYDRMREKTCYRSWEKGKVLACTAYIKHMQQRLYSVNVISILIKEINYIK